MISNTRPIAAKMTATGTQIIEDSSEKEPFGRLSRKMTVEIGERLWNFIAFPPTKMATGPNPLPRIEPFAFLVAAPCGHLLIQHGAQEERRRKAMSRLTIC